MGNQVVKKKKKRIGAFIGYASNNDLDYRLEDLVKYQEENNIKKIKRYYTAKYEDEYGNVEVSRKVITDIFLEDIDTLLVVGTIEMLIPEYRILEKIMQNIELIEV